ncbi:MAG: CocE/NonD family hydrolase, partial [Candidatus Hodarchaeales archaeon]|jgi:predicted acyl esterase
MIVLIGSLYFPIAVFIVFYSLLMAGSFLKQFPRNNNVNFVLVGNILNVVTPLIGFLWFGGKLLEVTAVGTSILAFLHYGQKPRSFSLPNRIVLILQRFNRYTKFIYLGFLIILMVIPSIILLGAIIYTPPSKQTFNIPMRDGIELATDLYLAPGSLGNSRPVILIRTTYGKGGSLGIGFYGLLYLTQGYHIVVQDCRGTFDSGDKENFLVYNQDYNDGVDTLNWILNQSWCNGKIASVGGSALAINQFFYAGMNPNGLAVQSLAIGSPDLYKTTMFRGGAFGENTVVEWLKGTVQNYDYQLSEVVAHSRKDSSYFNATSLFISEGPNFQKINIPAIHIGGWYDVFQQGTLDGFMGYDDLGMSRAKGKQLLIMGPFTHLSPMSEGYQGELFFPTKSKSFFNLFLDWETKLFDHVLLGTNFDWSQPRVAYYMMGDNTSEDPTVNDYRYASDWPVPYANDSWYFTSSYGLTKGSSSINANYSYLFDPTNPVPSIGGNNLMMDAGPYDQRTIENRNDVLIFETPVLSEKVEVVGQMWANLWIMSNCSNTDFTVKITDVYPDGRSMLLTDGIINSIRRDGMEKDAPSLTPNQPVKVTIDLWSTAYQFDPGHQIRVAISSSNYPRFAINPNSGAPQEVYSYQYLDRNIANNTILVGPTYPSSIILPRPTSD